MPSQTPKSEIQNRDTKFLDEGKLLYEFGDEFLVICPKCKGMAKVVPISLTSTEFKDQLFSPRKLICLNCIYRDTWNTSQIAIGENFDWYFRLPLWLQISCCSETLWAYNKDHLDFIEQYVAAKLRERKPNINSSLASRLPQWLKSAKNRDEILRAIEKLRTKLSKNPF